MGQGKKKKEADGVFCDDTFWNPVLGEHTAVGSVANCVARKLRLSPATVYFG